MRGNTSKAAGIDRLPRRFLKDGANVLAKPVTDVCNLSTSLNKFPNAFKLAKVTTIFSKKNEKIMSQINDLSLYCQYFQRSLKSYSRTTKFWNDNNISYIYQPGFRNTLSTDLYP